MSFVEVNGVRLHVVDEGRGEPILLLHGFTGSAASWDTVAKALVSRRRVIRVDLLGHGRSSCPVDPARYSLAQAAADLLAVMDARGVKRFTAAGYSMGGRAALHLALQAPERVQALVLESASYGIPDPAERAARRAQDEALAQRIEREGIEAFVAYWERLPLFETQRRLPPEVREAVRRERLGHSPAGLAASLRGAGAGVQECLAPRLKELTMPALIVAGSLDPKYCALAADMGRLLPNARVRIVEGAGHNVHLERPEEFIAELEGFLEAAAAG